MGLAIETLEREAYNLYIHVLNLKEEDFPFEAGPWEQVVITMQGMLPDRQVTMHWDTVAQRLKRAFGGPPADKKTLAAFNVVARHLSWLTVSSGTSDALEVGREARAKRWPGIFTRLMERE